MVTYPKKPSVDDLRSTLQILANEANGWFAASKRCFADVPMTPNVSQSLTNQAVVCNSFAIELYLKAILIAGGSLPAAKHDAQFHFSALPEPVKDKIRVRFRKQVPSVSLDVLLNENKLWFQQFRYIYETVAKYIGSGQSVLPGLNFNVQWAITRSLHNTLVELAPNLTFSGESGRLFDPASLHTKYQWPAWS